MNHLFSLRSVANQCALALACTVVAQAAMAAGQHPGGHADSAIGEAGKAHNVTRTVKIDMSDAMRYTPASIDAKQGETIRFVVSNSGKVKHELVLGTEKELKEHYEVMKKFPEMEHDDPNMVSLAPGKTGEVIWKFTKAGKIEFACLQPGHYEAGMKGAVAVARTATRKAAAASTAMLTGTVAPAAAIVSTAQQEPAANTKIAQAAGASDMAEGEVRRIDSETGKVTLKHGDIKHLDMPAMTMVFTAKDKTLLNSLKVGDKVKFRAVNDAGVFVLTEVQSAR